ERVVEARRGVRQALQPRRPRGARVVREERVLRPPAIVDEQWIIAAQHGERASGAVRDATGRDLDAELVRQAGDDAASERKRQLRFGNGGVGDEAGQGRERRVVGRVQRQLRDRPAPDERDGMDRVRHLEEERAGLARETGEDVERVPPERERKEGKEGHRLRSRDRCNDGQGAAARATHCVPRGSPVPCECWHGRGRSHVDDGQEQDAEAAQRAVAAWKDTAPGSAEDRGDRVGRRGACGREGARRERSARDRRDRTGARGGGSRRGQGTTDAGPFVVDRFAPQWRPLSHHRGSPSRARPTRLDAASSHALHLLGFATQGGRPMALTSARAVLLVACLGWTGCTAYNPNTGLYETDPVGTSLVAGGLGMAGGVALGPALADHDDCCWGGGYHGGDVNVYNNYNRTNNYNRNANYNRNVNRNRANYGGGGGRGGWGGGGRSRGGFGGGGRGRGGGGG